MRIDCQVYESETNTVISTFDSGKLGQASDLAIVQTELHEAVHAYVVATFFQTSSYEERQKILGDNWTYPVFGQGGHGFIVDNYINDITSALQEFGFTQHSDGSYTFYTKGVDRFTYDWSSENISYLINSGNSFADADNLWKSFQKKIKEFVDTHGGNANINVPQKIRPDWYKMLKVLDPNDPTSISDLEECQ